MAMRGFVVVTAFLLGVMAWGAQPHATHLAEGEPPEKLSAYALFAGDPRQQRPAAGVLKYDLTTPLFSDYTLKHRFIKLPPGTMIHYRDDGVFHFPVGTIIAKTFTYPHDQRRPQAGERLLETRLLIRKSEGWIGLPYLWNEAQTEAELDEVGGTVDVSWIHDDGQPRKNNYIIPNTNQCKGCHENQGVMEPIGPKARYLNRSGPGGVQNQLEHWHEAGALAGLPEKSKVPKTAVWNDPATGTLQERARVWLEINCAHCHNPRGPAMQSGLDLRLAQHEPAKYGVWKSPVAAGRGSGGRLYDIVPGEPDASIMVFRLESTEPGVKMPELPSRMVDAEGVKLIREWIASMPRGQPPAPGLGRQLELPPSGPWQVRALHKTR
jgi:uncharacterized repeat protein (TIGR03806 family)